MNKQQFLLSEVARLVGVKAFHISYALANGYVEEPAAEWINNKRIFTQDDIARIREYFANKPRRGKAAGGHHE